MDPAREARAALLGSTPTVAAPTTNAACSDARAGSISPVLRDATLRQSGSPLRRDACSPWESQIFSVGRRLLAQFHRFFHCIHRKVVVRDLRHFVPVEARGVSNRVLQAGRGATVGHDVKPVAGAPILGDTTLLRCE